MKVLRSLLYFMLCLFIISCGDDDDDDNDDFSPSGDDNVAPSVVSSVPADGATDVDVSTTLRITFSESIDIQSIDDGSFQLKPEGSTDDIGIGGTVGIEGSLLTFDPDDELQPGTKYTLSLSTAITDNAGNNLSSAFSFSFTTRSAGGTPGSESDVTAPTVSSVAPVDAAADVLIGTDIVITFSENIDPSSVNTSNVTLSSSSGNQTASLSVTDNKLTIDPSSDLDQLVTYTVTVGTGLLDLAGNTLATSFVSSFTTESLDVTAPTLVSRSIATDETGVAADTDIVLTFSEPMKLSSLDGRIILFPTGGSGSDILDVTFSVSGNDVIINPNENLKGNVQYSYKVLSAVTDLAGNHFGSEPLFSFTTEIVPVRIASSVPSNNATGVEVNLNSITITMTEEIDASTTTATNRLQLLEFKFGDSPSNITGTIQVNGNQITFTPSSGFVEFGTQYTLFLDNEIKDIYGNPHALDFSDEEKISFTMIDFSELYSYTIENKSNGNTLSLNSTTSTVGFVEDAGYTESSSNQRRWIITDQGSYSTIKNVHFNNLLEALPTTIGGELVLVNTTAVIGAQWTITQFDDLSFDTSIYNLYSRSTLLDGDPDLKINSLTTDTSDTSNQWEFTRSNAL